MNAPQRISLALLVASAMALFAACEEKKTEPDKTAPTASASAAVTTPSATPASSTPTPAAEGSGDTEEDFEDEAEKSVSADTLEEEVLKLEKEIK